MARILIVDDAVFMRKQLRDIFDSQGHEVIGEATTAKEGIDQFKALKPDLMTIDIVMPQEDGIETIDAVRLIMKEFPQARILVISSQGQQAVISEMLQAGACDFIVKPFEKDQVIKAVSRLIRPVA